MITNPTLRIHFNINLNNGLFQVSPIYRTLFIKEEFFLQASDIVPAPTL